MKSHVKCTLNWNHVFEICHYPRSRPNLKCNKIILLSRGNSANASYAIWSRTFVAIYLANLFARRSLFTWWLRRYPAANLRRPRWCHHRWSLTKLSFCEWFFVFLQVLSTYTLMIYGTLMFSRNHRVVYNIQLHPHTFF